MNADELLDRIYSEAEPMTDAGLTPMGVGDVSGYRLDIGLMQEIENHLQEYWDRLEQEEAARPAPAGSEESEDR